MKKGILSLFMVFVLASFTSPKAKEVLKCARQSEPMRVDGKADDWNNNNLSFDSKTGYSYAFSNDNKNLYVRLRMSNMMEQRKVMATGLTLWIDPSGKGKNVLGIQYPKNKVEENRRENHHPSQRRQGDAQRKAFTAKEKQEQMIKFNLRYSSGVEIGKLKGFDKAGLDNAFLGDGGIEVMLQINQHDQLIYEAKIPLAMIFSHPQDYLKASPKSFSLAFETGYIQVDMSRMRGGMGGGRMGGRMGQGFYGGRSAAMQFMTSSTKIKWKKAVLNSRK